MHTARLHLFIKQVNGIVCLRYTALPTPYKTEGRSVELKKNRISRKHATIIPHSFPDCCGKGQTPVNKYRDFLIKKRVTIDTPYFPNKE